MADSYRSTLFNSDSLEYLLERAEMIAVCRNRILT